MSTPENTENPPLTRRQLRELRQTGATPIITPETDAAAPAPEPELDTAPPAAVSASAGADAAPEPAASTPSEVPAPAARPSAFEPAFADHGSELGVSGLTRRQARAQEKIRTAAVPIISPDLEPALPGQSAPFAPLPDVDPSLPAIFRPAAPDAPDIAEVPAADEGETPGPSVVNPALGSELLGGAKPDVSMPASFDQLISRTASASGAVSTPNALILSQTPTGVPLVGPVTATGEVMITGTFELPEGLGSIGHAPGTTDGHDVDAVLLDGELPPASSPTPIAASAAISTVKQPGEIIRPPAPEKGSKLLVGLIITTGALALAVAVTLVLAFTTGVFR